MYICVCVCMYILDIHASFVSASRLCNRARDKVGQGGVATFKHESQVHT